METAKAGNTGHAPKVAIKPIGEDMTEQEKYEKMWTFDKYRKVSPGELAGAEFISIAQPEPGDEVIDFGCGTGRGSLMLIALAEMKPTMVDFAENCLDEDLVNACKNRDDTCFIQHDLTQPLDIHKKYGYCTDVMEHIPEEDVDTVLDNILNAAEKVFFRISTTPDVMGPAHLGIHLHLTVREYGWWAKKFLEKEVIILHSQQHNGYVDFYVNGWSTQLPSGKVNVEEETVINNIIENAKWGCSEVRPHNLQPEKEIMLLAGGPSLNDFEDEILENHRNGMPVVTVNGTYKWAIDRGIERVNQCMIDARPFNKRFIEPVRDDCYYFIGTQCDPSVFEALPKDRTFYWHISLFKNAIDAATENYEDPLFCVGGSTVALRAIVLMRVLGFKRMHVYGLDSCLMGDEHHAYEQSENDMGSIKPIEMVFGDRTFKCHPWMAYQAHDFMSIVRQLGDEFELDVKGDGLIAHILKTGAELPAIEEET